MFVTVKEHCTGVQVRKVSGPVQPSWSATEPLELRYLAAGILHTLTLSWNTVCRYH